MTIRTKIMLVIALLGGMLTLLAMADGIRAVNTYREDLAAIEINDASNYMLKAAGAWAVERGTTAGALGNPSKATARQLALIREKRLEADSAFDAAVAIIRGHGTGIIERDIKQVESDLQALKQLRIRVDSALNKRENAPQKELQGAAFKASTKLIVDSQHLRIHEEQQLGNHVPSHVVLAFAIRHGLWVASEYAGRERGFMAGRIGAGEFLNNEQLSTMSRYRGHLENGWEIADLEKTELSAIFQTRMAEANRLYFQEFEAMRAAVYEASNNQQPYPVTAEEWFNSATKGIGAFLAAQEIAATDVRAMLQLGLDEAFWWAVFDFSILAV